MHTGFLSREEILSVLATKEIIIGERAKRARHSQVCSIENCDIL